MTPLTRQQISILATYMPEGVTDEDVEFLVRKVEEIHFFNAEASGPGDKAGFAEPDCCQKIQEEKP